MVSLGRLLRLVFETRVTSSVNVVLYTQGNDVGDTSLIFFELVSCDVFDLCEGVYQIYAIKKKGLRLFRLFRLFRFFRFVLLFRASETGAARSANGTRLMLRMEFYSVLLATDSLQFDRAVLL